MKATEVPSVAPKQVALSKERPPITVATGGAEVDEHFDWCSLIRISVHDLKVSIIEALDWVGEPLSAAELEEIFDKRWNLGSVAYHLTNLKKHGILEVSSERAVRGARESYYYFVPASV